MMSPAAAAADLQDDVEKIAGSTAAASRSPSTDLERQQQTSLPPSFDDPTSDGRTATSSEPQSSLDKMHEQSAAVLDHEVAKDEAITRKQKYLRHLTWAKARYVLLPAWAALVIAWWASSVWNVKTRHRWIQSTVIAWFIVLIVLFRFVPSSVVSRPVGRVWGACVQTPFFKLPRVARFIGGWLALFALIFGSAYGFDLPEGTTYGDRTISIFGLLCFNIIYWLCSRNRKLIQWNTVIVGLIFQQSIALFVLKSGAGFSLFKWIANAAADFLHQGGLAATFFSGNDPTYTAWFLFGTLGAVIFFIAFVQMMFYLGAMTWVIQGFSWLFFKTMNISGAEAVIAAASPFIGQGESACLVKPFVDLMTPSEIHLAMCSGFSTISGSVLSGYILLGVPPESLITASVMSIPASIAISKIVYPEDEVPITLGRVVVDRGAEDNAEEGNLLHAFSNGAWFGLKVAGLILCNVLVVLALLYVIDGVLTWVGKAWNIENFTLELIFQYIFYPLAWLMGVPKQDLLITGRLLGLKLFGNEFVAYRELQSIGRANMTARGYLVSTYSLCGFANMGSLGIQIGVISGLAPSRAKIISVIGPSALIFGFLSTCQTATIAGMMA